MQWPHPWFAVAGLVPAHHANGTNVLPSIAALASTGTKHGPIVMVRRDVYDYISPCIPGLWRVKGEILAQISSNNMVNWVIQLGDTNAHQDLCSTDMPASDYDTCHWNAIKFPTVLPPAAGPGWESITSA